VQTRDKLDLDRQAIRFWYLSNRNRTAEIFNIAGGAYYERPIALRNPIVFYDGHIPAFTYAKLLREGLGAPAIDDSFAYFFLIASRSGMSFR